MRAQIVRFKGLSSHADRDGLLRWMETYQPKPRQTFVVHGSYESTENYASLLREHGFAAHAPNYEEVYDLLENRMLSEGISLAPKPAPSQINLYKIYLLT